MSAPIERIQFLGKTRELFQRRTEDQPKSPEDVIREIDKALKGNIGQQAWDRFTQSRLMNVNHEYYADLRRLGRKG